MAGGGAFQELTGRTAGEVSRQSSTLAGAHRLCRSHGVWTPFRGQWSQWRLYVGTRRPCEEDIQGQGTLGAVFPETR